MLNKSGNLTYSSFGNKEMNKRKKYRKNMGSLVIFIMFYLQNYSFDNGNLHISLHITADTDLLKMVLVEILLKFGNYLGTPKFYCDIME